MRTVLASVTEKTGLDKFLKRLQPIGPVKGVATSSTSAFLTERGFSCSTVEELTGFPEILGGRVKTLHPRVFGGILARQIEEDRACLAQMAIPQFDIVVVNLYAFEKKLGLGLSEPEMIENIDVGGVALLRAAAKNFDRIVVASDPSQYEAIIDSMVANGGELPRQLRKKLAIEALRRTSSYDAAISSYLESTLGAQAETKTPLPESLTVRLEKQQDLRYGENPHMAAAWYRLAQPSESNGVKFPPFEQLQGKELSSNNITDVFALAQILRSIGRPGACIIKHNNPCGVAEAGNIAEAFERAYKCDSTSAFGGIYGFTDKVNKDLATQITDNFFEIVLAPEYDPEALEVLSKKKNVRVLTSKSLAKIGGRKWQLKDLRDYGFLIEQESIGPVDAAQFQCPTAHKVDANVLKDVVFAWGVVKHLTSNAIFVAKDRISLGFGIGQTSRIASVNIALAQAGQAAKGAVLASDAFFPATDNIESAAKAGIKVIVQPGGSLKDAEVIAACDRAGIAMLFTGQRCFKH